MINRATRQHWRIAHSWACQTVAETSVRVESWQKRDNFFLWLSGEIRKLSKRAILCYGFPSPFSPACADKSFLSEDVLNIQRLMHLNIRSHKTKRTLCCKSVLLILSPEGTLLFQHWCSTFSNIVLGLTARQTLWKNVRLWSIFSIHSQGLRWRGFDGL